VKPPLTRVDDGAVDRLAFGEDDFQTGPGFFAASLVAADDGFAQGVFDAVQIDFDVVADLRDVGAFADAEFRAGMRPSVFRPTSMIAMSFSMPTTRP
jgi:hypothetical protein